MASGTPEPKRSSKPKSAGEKASDAKKRAQAAGLQAAAVATTAGTAVGKAVNGAADALGGVSLEKMTGMMLISVERARQICKYR